MTGESLRFVADGSLESLPVGSPDWRRAVGKVSPEEAVTRAFSQRILRGGEPIASLQACAKGERVRAVIEPEGGPLPEDISAKWIDAVFLNTTAREIEVEQAGTDLLVMSRDGWSRGRDIRIATERTVLRPFVEVDAPAFREIAGNLEVARMMINIEHPLSTKTAARWIRQRRFRGRPGFFLGIYVGEQLAGSIGFGAFSNALAYFLARPQWGKGLAGEVVPAFVANVVPRFALPSMFAGVFTDNPASSRILERIGFREVTRSDFQSPARDAPDRIIEMELTPEQAPDYFAAIRLGTD
ncbi:GNAT family N-acetyltransferase [Aliiruegeria lutimaris]|uniref:Protein N-acetyltransferase, RimJ/RimL family n=1 Tax=Aliiruegeria lutimaris TaxID=571298 RepID=A0A1G8QYV8_9RHOB|nr:GNAT family N-acetyltransferase [Aliiruegeria lutimaris]SDJ09906.1 Protein N-acetyltransferase, RimJ/RimL family [Aliiruegeria lutimaris]